MGFKGSDFNSKYGSLILENLYTFVNLPCPIKMAVLAGVATLSVTGFTVMSSVAAQMTGDNTTMTGNMTGGNVTGGNTTEASGTISSEGGGGTVSESPGGTGGCLDC